MYALFRFVSVLALLIACHGTDAWSQARPIALICLQPAEPTERGAACELQPLRSTAQQTVRLRVVDPNTSQPIENAKIAFTPSNGSMPKEERTNREGEVSVVWTRLHSDTAAITAEASFGNETTRRQIKIKPPLNVPSYTLDPVSGYYQSWYENRQLVRPVVVRIREHTGEMSQEKCERIRIAFTPAGSGGVVSPDTVQAVWRVPVTTKGLADLGRASPPGEVLCLAQARWKLAEGIGEQHIEARVVGGGSQPELVTAWARASPRVIMGIAGSVVKGYDAINERKQKVTTVHRVLEDVVLMKDSTVTLTSFDRKDGGLEFFPVVGVDWPLFQRYHWLRVSVATDVRNPVENWFFGLSAAQLRWGLPQEGVGYDVQVFAHLGERNEVQNRAVCEADGSACVTEDNWSLVGAGAMFVLDGGSLFSKLLEAIGK